MNDNPFLSLKGIDGQVNLVNLGAFLFMGLIALVELHYNWNQLTIRRRSAWSFALAASFMYLLATFNVYPAVTGLLGHFCNLIFILCLFDCVDGD